MDNLEALVSEREKIRSQERELTQKIKIERSKLPAQKKVCDCSAISKKEHIALRKQNSDLKALLSVLLRDSGLTFKKIGEMLGVSDTRANQIVHKQLRIFRRLNYELDDITEDSHLSP